MLPLALGLLLVLILFGLILADMERNRRQLAELLGRLEPLVERGRRLHVRNLRGLNNSLLYAYNLLEHVVREVGALEQQRGVPPPAGGGRFSLKPGRRLRDLDARIAALAAIAGQGPAAAPGPQPPAPDAARGPAEPSTEGPARA